MTTRNKHNLSSWFRPNPTEYRKRYLTMSKPKLYWHCRRSWRLRMALFV